MTNRDIILYGSQENGYVIRGDSTKEFFGFIKETISEINKLSTEVELLKLENKELKGFVNGITLTPKGRKR